ncbi:MULTISPECIES: hypothetical protein [unclassified Psychrobacillus]|uniref:hypothetical protein n=1 Tax=unclassified Psychrobacillus TaxID=2636677 RepID=UPI0030FBA383
MRDLVMWIIFWSLIISAAAIAVGCGLALGKVTLGWALLSWLFPFAIKSIIFGIVGFVLACVAMKFWAPWDAKEN